MNEGKKLSRWPKMLDEAGLLDEIDGGWDLPDAADLDGAIIKVDGTRGSAVMPTVVPAPPKSDEKRTDGAVTRSEPAPMIIESEKWETDDSTRKVKTTDVVADDMPASDISQTLAKEITGETELPEQEKVATETLSRTPVERIRSSHPNVSEKTTPIPAPRIPVTSFKATMDGIPRTPARLPSFNPVGTAISSADPEVPWEEPIAREAPVDSVVQDAPVELETEEETRERVENMRGTGISIAPESVETSVEVSEQLIVDEPRLDSLVGQDDPSLHQTLNHHYDLGDFSGALDVAERILEGNPRDSVALSRRDSSREVLMKMFESRIGPFDSIPTLAVTDHELIWRNLDSASGFVLSRIDGMSSYEDIIDISGLPRFETCRILNQLLQDAIIK